MSWHSRMHQGSFRNARFHIETDDMEFGRRNEHHEFPLRDHGYMEDLGRKDREFNQEWFVIGPNYMAERDALIAVLEKPGPGTLVHPWMGRMRVSVRSARKKESTKKGGMATFTVTFIEAGAEMRPDSILDTVFAVLQKAASAIAQFPLSFGAIFSVTGMPEFVRQAATGVLFNAVDAVHSTISIMPGDVTKASGISSGLTSFSNNLTTLITQPTDLADTLLGVMSDINDAATAPVDAYHAHRRLFSFGVDASVVPLSTPARKQQEANQVQVISLVRRAAIIGAAMASAHREYDSYSEAIQVRDELAEQLEIEMNTADDATYQVLSDLRVAVVRDIAERGAKLPRIVQITPHATLPALVMAHTIYGDATREPEIISRNHIHHPGFVPGGQVLEVLTDA